MQWIYLAIAILIAAGMGALGAAAWTRRGRAGLVFLALALALLAAGVSLFWKEAVLAVAIAGVCLLGLAVMFRRIPPGKALAGALAGFTLLFAFTWLAQQLADVFLFETRPEFLSGEGWDWKLDWTFSFPDGLPVDILAPLGLACLVAGIAARKTRALWLFAGMALLLLTGPAFLEQQGFDFHEIYPLEPWVVRLGLFLFVVAIVLSAVTNSRDSETR